MKKSIKSVTSITLCIATILCVTSLASAAESSFTKSSVDSNSYSFVTTEKKDTTSTTAAVKIENIYKADGSASNYSTVDVKATSSGTGVSVNKGSTVDISIPSGSQSSGSYVAMYSKGNIPWLDCKISGYWNVH